MVNFSAAIGGCPYGIDNVRMRVAVKFNIKFIPNFACRITVWCICALGNK